jgi:Reverse transcriptase (RNA-dependent DNA polymerase)
VYNDGTIVCRLKRALYGTIEAARLWYEMFVKDAIKLGYEVNEVDMCVFRRYEIDGSISVLVLHVDDLLIRALNESVIDSIIKQWNDIYPGVTEHRGRKIEYLGMMFDFTVAGEVNITQNGFIDKLLNECNDMVGESDTPHSADLFSINDKLGLMDSAKQELFHSRTQSLLYLAKRTRPDIQTSVGFLGRRVKKATGEDWNKISKVIKFIRKTKSVGLRFRCGVDKLKVTAFVDVSYASHADRKSHTGCSIFIGDVGAIYCKSSRQNIVTKSSSEAELVGATDLAGAYLWIKNYLKYQSYDMVQEVDLRQDNKAVISWLKNGKAKDEKGRHISIRYFWLADRIKRGNLVVNYTSTNDMVADYLSKPLVGAIFDKFRNMILGISSWNV